MPAKGQPRPPGAGRKKGTPNRATADLRAMMEEEVGMPLPVAMVKLAKRYMAKGEETMQTDLISVGGRLMAQACDYAYPKLKAIEHSGGIETTPMPVLQIVMSDDEKKQIDAATPARED